MTNEERIHSMITKLATKFPGKYVSIKTACGKHPHNETNTTEYNLYVADVIHLPMITSFLELEMALITIMAFPLGWKSEA